MGTDQISQMMMAADGKFLTFSRFINYIFTFLFTKQTQADSYRVKRSYRVPYLLVGYPFGDAKLF